MRTVFEDPTRPRAVTLAALLVVVQTTLWIAALMLLAASLMGLGYGAFPEPFAYWLLPARDLIWHLLKMRFAEALGLAVLAAATLKRQSWARRLLEVAIVVRGLMPLPTAVALLSQGPLVLGAQHGWRNFGYTWLPLLLLTLPMPIILRLLEAPGNSDWFRGVSRASKDVDQARTPRVTALARALKLGIAIVVVGIIGGWYYRISAPLGDALRIRGVRMERARTLWADSAHDDGTVLLRFAFELENTSWRSIVLKSGNIAVLSHGEPPEVHRVGLGWTRPIASGAASSLEVTVVAPPDEEFVFLATCYGDKWDYRADTGQMFVFAIEASQGGSFASTDLRPAPEHAARVQDRVSPYTGGRANLCG